MPDSRRGHGFGGSTRTNTGQHGLRGISIGSGETRAKIWDATVKVLIRELGEHEGELRVCFFSPDGFHIATGADDHMLKVWDGGNREPIGEYDCGAAITVAKWSPTGDLIVVGTASGELLMLRPTNF